MKFIASLFIILTTCLLSSAQSPLTMHRLQDSIRNSDGLYFAKSTEGHFSVLLPFPFNDFTVKVDGVTSYYIGCKTSDGFTFLVMEVEKTIKNKVIDENAFIQKLKKPTNTVQTIQKEKTDNHESIAFLVEEKQKGSLVKYINTSSRLFTMTIEFPIEFKGLVEKEFAFFFSSIIITDY